MSLADLTVIAPVYGNAPVIAELFQRTAAALRPLGLLWRMVFVVDASPDDSWHMVERLAAADPEVGGILLGRRVGQHAAIMAGIAAVAARWYLVMDADLQDPPEMIPAFWRRAHETDGTVFGRRCGRHQGLGRRITSRVFKGLLAAVARLPADVGTFFVVPDGVATAMCAAAVSRPHATVLAHRHSPRWTALPYAREQRRVGASTYSSWGRLRAAGHALGCVWQCRRNNPARPSLSSHRRTLHAVTVNIEPLANVRH